MFKISPAARNRTGARPRTVTAIALESRMLFDGAALASAMSADGSVAERLLARQALTPQSSLSPTSPLSSLSPLRPTLPDEPLFAMPVDHFSPFAADQVLRDFAHSAAAAGKAQGDTKSGPQGGVDKQAGPAANANRPAAGDTLAANRDDCMADRSAAADRAAPARKIERPGSALRADKARSESFSEQVQLARKPFRAPLRAQPAPPAKDC